MNTLISVRNALRARVAALPGWLSRKPTAAEWRRTRTLVRVDAVLCAVVALATWIEGWWWPRLWPVTSGAAVFAVAALIADQAITSWSTVGQAGEDPKQTDRLASKPGKR